MDNNYEYLKNLLVDANDNLDSILSAMEDYADLFPNGADKDDFENENSDIFILLQSMYKLVNSIKDKEFYLRRYFYKRMSFYGDEFDI